MLAITMDSISGAALSLWAVGSFIIFFSAAISLMQAVGLFSLLSSLVATPLSWLGLPPSLTDGVLRGVIEMTNGCNAIANASAPLSTKVLACTLIISFSGGCIIAQSTSEMRHIPVKISWLVMVKCIQSVLALLLCSLLLPLFPLVQSTMSFPTSFSSLLGANATLLISATIILSLLGTAMALYNLRNLPKENARKRGR